MKKIDERDQKKLKEILQDIPITSPITPKTLWALLKRAYTLGRERGYGQGVMEGVEMGVEGW